MTDPLTDATDWTKIDDGLFEGELSGDWANGPGAYGGIVAAALLRQMERTLDSDEQHPRTLHLHMCAPFRFEPATMEIHLDRKGRSISHLSARVEQDGEVPAFASATFADERSEAPERRAMDPAEIPPPDDVPTAPEFPLTPEYWANFFDLKFCIGEAPMSDAEVAESGGWLATDEPFEDGPLLAAALLDAWPPSALPTYEDFRRTVTVDLRYQFWDALDRSGPTDEFFLFEAASRMIDGGYAQEDAELWDADGSLVARAQQLYAILD